MELLQTVNTLDIQDYTLQYGVLGILAFVLGYFAYIQYKRLVKKNDDLEQKVDRLQEEMMSILIEERDRLAELIKENSNALKELQQTILKYMIKKSD